MTRHTKSMLLKLQNCISVKAPVAIISSRALCRLCPSWILWTNISFDRAIRLHPMFANRAFGGVWTLNPRWWLPYRWLLAVQHPWYSSHCGHMPNQDSLFIPVFKKQSTSLFAPSNHEFYFLLQSAFRRCQMPVFPRALTEIRPRVRAVQAQFIDE